MQVLDEAADLHGHGIVAQGDRVHGQSAEVVHHRDQTQQVFLDGDVERVAVLEVDRDCTCECDTSSQQRDIWTDGRTEDGEGNAAENVPPKISPTSSSVNSRPTSPGFLSLDMPPSQAHSKTVEMAS